MPIIEVENLVKIYDGTNVVDGVSFTVEEGEIFGIVGPNGAGKTTIVESVEGLRQPDGGSIRVLDLDPIRDRYEITERLGAQLQESSLAGVLDGATRLCPAAWISTRKNYVRKLPLTRQIVVSENNYNQGEEPMKARETTRVSTARWTGVFYLGLGVAGLVGFLFVRAELYVADDPTATLANLVDQVPLARLGIAADLTIVLTQALAAMWFFKLFRSDNSFAAGSIAAFGLVNAAAIVIATAFSATALVVAGDAALAPSGDQAATVQLLYELNGAMWDIGGLFFGLWLFPMGYVVVKYRVMPAALGWVLMVGGVAYVISTYLTLLVPDAPTAVGSLLIGVATIGEFWIIGYLLIFGVRTPDRIPPPSSSTAAA